MTYRYLPTIDGGFIRKSIEDMLEKEKEFIQSTDPIRRLLTEESKTEYQRLAKDILFKE